MKHEPAKIAHPAEAAPADAAAPDAAARRREAQRRARAEAAARKEGDGVDLPVELHGRGGKEPTRYGDWEVKGIASDF